MQVTEELGSWKLKSNRKLSIRYFYEVHLPGWFSYTDVESVRLESNLLPLIK